MNTNHSSDHIGVVWATVFLTALNLFGLAMMAFLDLTNPRVFEPVAVALLVGTAPAIVTVPLLLGCQKPESLKLVIGKVLMWPQALAIAVAVVLAAIVVIRGSL